MPPAAPGHYGDTGYARRRSADSETFEGQSKMRELVLTCALAMLGSGCVEVISHRDEFDAGPDIVIRDSTGEPEVGGGGECQSGVRWNGNNPDAVHFPGRPCMGSGCHSATSRTPMTIGGTVYPIKGQHDEDNCYGLNPAMTPAAIVPMDSPMGMELIGRLAINGSGNFYSNKALPQSFHVKVISMGREALQNSPVTDGNCNSCHTRDGVAGAKGRITPEPP
jgi:hypothetical protein